MLQKLVRDPLLHFTLAAALIFVLVQVAGGASPRRETIRVSQADLERLVALYAGETGTVPGPADIEALVADHVETLALAQEARRLGLDAGDVVVERRLAQKMRFMVDDLSEPGEPGNAELQRWYDENVERFTRPARYSFDVVYFREPGDPRFAPALAALTTYPSADWQRLGDAFMLQRRHAELPLLEVTRLFGAEFAQSVSSIAPTGVWQGPVSSSLGTHIVRVTQILPAEVPALDAVRGDVISQWQGAQRQKANAEAVSEIVSGYRVEIEGAAP